MVEVRVEFGNDEAHLDELGPRPDNGHDLAHGAVFHCDCTASFRSQVPGVEPCDVIQPLACYAT